MPQVKGGPNALNRRLEEVYAACMDGQDGSSANKRVCSAAAWKQVKKDGWSQSGGKWQKRKSKRQ